MAAQRPAVLRFTRDAVFLGHLFGRLTHRFARRRLGDRGRDRDEVARADLQEGAQPRAERLGLARLDENVGEAPGGEDRDVGQRFGAPGNDDVSVAEHDLVMAASDRLGGGGAGTVHGVGGDFLGKLGQQAHLAADVRDEGRRHDLAEDHFVDVGAVHIGALDQLARGVAGEIHGAGVLERRPRFAERRAATGNHRHAPPVPNRH